jgi:hypothetical protein
MIKKEFLKKLATLFYVDNKHNMSIHGGAIRDTLQGVDYRDIDIYYNSSNKEDFNHAVESLKISLKNIGVENITTSDLCPEKNNYGKPSAEVKSPAKSMAYHMTNISIQGANSYVKQVNAISINGTYKGENINIEVLSDNIDSWEVDINDVFIRAKNQYTDPECVFMNDFEIYSNHFPVKHLLKNLKKYKIGKFNPHNPSILSRIEWMRKKGYTLEGDNTVIQVNGELPNNFTGVYYRESDSLREKDGVINLDDQNPTFDYYENGVLVNKIASHKQGLPKLSDKTYDFDITNHILRKFFTGTTVHNDVIQRYFEGTLHSHTVPAYFDLKTNQKKYYIYGKEIPEDVFIKDLNRYLRNARLNTSKTTFLSMLANNLDEKEAVIHGGCIRDVLTNIEYKDIDVYISKEMMAEFKRIAYILEGETKSHKLEREIDLNNFEHKLSDIKKLKIVSSLEKMGLENVKIIFRYSENHEEYVDEFNKELLNDVDINFSNKINVVQIIGYYKDEKINIELTEDNNSCWEIDINDVFLKKSNTSQNKNPELFSGIEIYSRLFDVNELIKNIKEFKIGKINPLHQKIWSRLEHMRRKGFELIGDHHTIKTFDKEENVPFDYTGVVFILRDEMDEDYQMYYYYKNGKLSRDGGPALVYDRLYLSIDYDYSIEKDFQTNQQYINVKCNLDFFKKNYGLLLRYFTGELRYGYSQCENYINGELIGSGSYDYEKSNNPILSLDTEMKHIVNNVNKGLGLTESKPVASTYSATESKYVGEIPTSSEIPVITLVGSPIKYTEHFYKPNVFEVFKTNNLCMGFSDFLAQKIQVDKFGNICVSKIENKATNVKTFADLLNNAKYRIIADQIINITQNMLVRVLSNNNSSLISSSREILKTNFGRSLLQATVGLLLNEIPYKNDHMDKITNELILSSLVTVENSLIDFLTSNLKNIVSSKVNELPIQVNQLQSNTTETFDMLDDIEQEKYEYKR